MDRIAEQGVTFENGYCNSPLCTPSRLSFMTGKYVSHCQGWDNSTPLYVGRMTWAWLLKSLGYDTALNGKMHMMGPRPLNGFDAQLSHDPHAANQHPVIRWKDGVGKGITPWPDVLRRGPGPQPGDRPRRGGRSGGPRLPARPGATGKTLGDGLRFHFAALPA